ncbi:MAG TPA: energy transducer TonB [Myxococcales bacterium]|jgi:TonB family protein|nr:energy transducer TonB [Myxococcales bacterium]
MSPLPHRPVRRRSRLTIALAVSLGLHLLLLPWIAKDAVFHIPPQLHRTPVGLIATPQNQVQHAERGLPGNAPSAGHSAPDQLRPQLPPALEPPKPKPAEKMEGQVVSLGQPKDERPPDKPTKYLSEHDSRVLKETRARETSPFFKNALSKVQKEGKNDAAKNAAAAPGAVQPGQNGGVQRQPERKLARSESPRQDRAQPLHLEKAPDGRVPDREGKNSLSGNSRALAMAEPPAQSVPQQEGPEGILGLQPGAPGTRGPLTLTLDRPGEALGPVAGGPMNDDLRGVEEGDETLLNSRSFRYAGFMNRVKETVSRLWMTRVEDESMKRDPTGSIYLWKDRRTVVEFTIDLRGELKDVHVTSPSGVPFLDEVAVDAFKRAERFPNPPPGLFNENGTATIGFGFVVGVMRGFRMRMAPAYLPNLQNQRGY